MATGERSIKLKFTEGILYFKYSYHCRRGGEFRSSLMSIESLSGFRPWKDTSVALHGKSICKIRFYVRQTGNFICLVISRQSKIINCKQLWLVNNCKRNSCTRLTINSDCLKNGLFGRVLPMNRSDNSIYYHGWFDKRGGSKNRNVRWDTTTAPWNICQISISWTWVRA